jgi:5-methylcytosine-specific restriction enzyme subunit McrC
MPNFIRNNEGFHFYEHQGYNNPIVINDSELSIENIHFQSDIDKCCLKVIKTNEKKTIELSYYVGIDWVNKEQNKAIYVQPKLNQNAEQTDYLKMLFGALKHNGVVDYTNQLFEIKWNLPEITIEQHQDLLTPLLIVQFLSLVKQIVRKGLKKSYYKVDSNLFGKVKGKVLVASTIKQNLINNKKLNTFCQYEEFGLNGLENRLLKKALIFVKRYMPTIAKLNSTEYISLLFNYINPAFELVCDEVNLNDVKNTKTNAFYKEYDEAIRLAKLILKRFGYNINSTQKQKVNTPPFWIDMSKLFELYILGMLKDMLGNSQVKYHFSKNWQELDFLLNTPDYKMVVDAKYKKVYKSGYEINDIRQVSGYARLKSVYKELSMTETEVIDCLIIYPDQENGFETLNSFNLKMNPINEFVDFYKVAVKLPTLKQKN